MLVSVFNQHFKLFLFLSFFLFNQFYILLFILLILYVIVRHVMYQLCYVLLGMDNAKNITERSKQFVLLGLLEQSLEFLLKPFNTF